MEPQNWWFVDVSPFPRGIFRFHLSFRGLYMMFSLSQLNRWRCLEVLQALSKIVPILSLLPVALVQSIVGYTGSTSTER